LFIDTPPAISKHLPIDLFWKLWYDLNMPSLTPKLIGGHTYYYARYCQRVDGKPKIVRQVYLGKIDDLVAAAERSQQPPQPLETEVAAFADIAALFDIAQRLDLVQLLDSILPAKRRQGLSVGQYLLLAAINRAVSPTSKLQFADWYRQTALTRLLPADPASLSSQNFWNHMNLVTAEHVLECEKQITQRLIQRFQLDLRALVYDGTNFFTYINTRTPAELPQRTISRSAAICAKSASVCWSAPISTSLCSTRFTPAMSTTAPSSNPSPRNSLPITGNWPNPAITSP
jgi:hypothetical protein